MSAKVVLNQLTRIPLLARAAAGKGYTPCAIIAGCAGFQKADKTLYFPAFFAVGGVLHTALDDSLAIESSFRQAA
jgi:hypothetical protein